jgi:hypothetical protein
MSAFDVVAEYEPYLPAGASSVAAVVRVTAAGTGRPGAEASLRLWTPLGAAVAVLRETSPASADLRERAVRLDDRTVAYPAGRWTGGARAYELAVALPARRAGDEMLAARLEIIVDGQVGAGVRISVTWTDDERLVGPPGDHAPTSAETAAAQRPTAPSPQPRHLLTARPAAKVCSRCGLAPADGDRFCERCGRELDR